MVRSFRFPAAFAISVAFAFVPGCTDPAGPASDPVRSSSFSPSFRTEHNAAGFGAVVTHGEQGAFFVAQDGLAMIIGWTFEELEQFCTTGEITIGSLRELTVTRPDGSLKYGLHGARIPLLVWRTDSGNLCEILTLPHLTGTGQMFASDNDFFVSGNRTESTVGLVQGKVTAEDGERFRYTDKFHAVILRSGELHKFVSEVELTQIGN